MRTRSVLLCAAVFGDVCRFLLLLIILLFSAALPRGEGTFIIQRSSDVFIPLFLAPLALFPIMAFFMWHDSEVCGFGRLYAAGKILCVIAAIVWSIKHISPANLFLLMQIQDVQLIILNCAVPGIMLWDVFSLVLIGIAQHPRTESAQ